MKWVFFGTPELAKVALEYFVDKGLVPSLVVSAPDKPKGRGLFPEPSPVSEYAEYDCKLEVITPESLKDEHFKKRIKQNDWDFFLVFAYGKIIPEWILNLPKYGTFNIHPSLLPKFRGPSPIESFILSDEKETGVTIMMLDKEVDHGPIISQVVVPLPNTVTAPQAEHVLALSGAQLFLLSIEEFVNGMIKPKEQNHDHATFTRKYTKEDGLISLSDDPQTLWKKFRAFDPWPGIYFFTEKNGKQIRVKIKDATLKDGVFEVLRVIPEGKKEMDYRDFLRTS